MTIKVCRIKMDPALLKMDKTPAAVCKLSPITCACYKAVLKASIHVKSVCFVSKSIEL